MGERGGKGVVWVDRRREGVWRRRGVGESEERLGFPICFIVRFIWANWAENLKQKKTCNGGPPREPPLKSVLEVEHIVGRL